MRQVVIGFKNGEPYVISAPRKVVVTFKTEKRRSLKKRLRTLLFRLRHRSA